MKSLVDYINEAQVKDIKPGTVVYFRFHDGEEIYKLTITKSEILGLYMCFHVEKNKANIAYFGTREKAKFGELYLAWVDDVNNGDPNHGYIAFEENSIRKDVSAKLQKDIDDVMSKISQYESQIMELQDKVKQLNSQKESLEKKINMETQ